MESENNHTTSATPNLSILLIKLFKSVLYRENDEHQWSALLNLQIQIRDYVSLLNLDLILDDVEGYAFLKSRPDPEENHTSPAPPRLIARRPLSFPVSLLLALLRKKLAEFDASGSETRLILSRDDIVELIRVFLPDTANETKLFDQIEITLNKVVDLGFLQKLRATGAPGYEVKRILKAFVDAQWLSEFDTRLAAYRERFLTDPNSGNTTT